MSAGGGGGRPARANSNRVSPANLELATKQKQAPAGNSAEFVTPAITLTQPAEELGNKEVSEILIPGSEEREEAGEEEERLRQSRDATQLPRSSARAWPGGWEGPTVIVDHPILEEGGKAEQQEECRDEEKEEREGDGPKQGSRWGQIRSRAMSYPISSPDSGSALLPLLRPQPAVGEKREGEGDEGGATGGEREAKSKESEGHEPQTTMIKFVQMALMAKKWKNRSMEETASPRTSGEYLLNRQKRRPMVELPRVLKLEVLEEAQQIVHKTLQRYRSELGLRHKLTLQAEQNCETLAEQIGHTHNSTH